MLVVAGLRGEPERGACLNERYVKPSWELQLDELFWSHPLQCSDGSFELEVELSLDRGLA